MLNRKLTVAAVAFALVLGMLAVGSFSADAAKAAKYEYVVLGMREADRTVSDTSGNKVSPLQSEFDQKGAEGWAFEGTIPGKGDAFFVVFSRAK
jgi:hypothetical protein